MKLKDECSDRVSDYSEKKKAVWFVNACHSAGCCYWLTLAGSVLIPASQSTTCEDNYEL